MSQAIKKAEEQLAKIIENTMGLSFQKNRKEEYHTQINKALHTLGHKSAESYLKILESNGNLIPVKDQKVIAEYLTISETFFFRESSSISVFRSVILPALIDKKKGETIKIWSAGCSSGEEAYTISMLIREHFPTIHDKTTILATDINPIVLEKAKAGTYTSWSFRETPDYYIDKYFTKEGSNFHIIPEIKRIVKFDFLNLVYDPFPGESLNTPEFDIIFCRNVLMYLKDEHIIRVANRFHKVLKNNGWFIAGQVELNDKFFGIFSKTYHEGGVFYRKGKTKEVKESKESIKQIVTKTKKTPTPKPKSGILKLLQKDRSSRQEVDQEQVITPEINTNASLFSMSKAEANKGNYSNAISILEKLKKTDNSTDDIFYLYGTIYLEQQETEKAKDMYKKALYINPKHLMSHIMLGNLLTAENRKKQAVVHYRNIADILKNLSDSEVIQNSDGLNRDRILDLIQNQINNLE